VTRIPRGSVLGQMEEENG